MKQVTPSGILAILVIVGASCSGSTATDSDGFDDGTDPDSPAPDDPELQVALPVFTPCPEGWSERSHGDVTYCSPLDVEALELDSDAVFPILPDCPAGEMWLPSGCAQLRQLPSCDADGYATDLPGESTIVYVKLGGGGGADGSRAKPYATLSAALAVAGPGEVIALAAGDYSGEGTHTINQGITLWGSCAPTLVGELVVSGAGAIHHLDAASVEVEAVTTATVHDVSAASYSGYGSVAMDHASISTLLQHGGSLAAHMIETESIKAVEAAHVEVSSAKLLYGYGGFSGSVSAGLTAQSGATITVSNIFIAALPPFAVEGSGSCRADASGLVADGGTIKASELVAYNHYGIAITANGPDSYLELDAAALLAPREIIVRFLDNITFEIFTGYCTSAGALVRSEVPPDVLLGFAVSQNDGGTLALRRTAIIHAAGTALRLRGSPTAAGACIDSGITSRAFLEDVLIANTTSHGATPADTYEFGVGGYGRGIGLECGAQLDGERVYIDDNRDVGIYAFGVSSKATLTDVHVSNTAAQGCTTSSVDCKWDATSSISAVAGANLELDRFLLDSSALIGVQVGANSDVVLHNGVVKNNPIAVNNQAPDFDLRRLQNNVLWLDNTVSLDAEDYTHPEPERDFDSL